MIQGCIDTESTKCPMASMCKRRKSAKSAPRGVTLLAAPFKVSTTETYDNAKCMQVTCDYFISDMS